MSRRTAAVSEERARKASLLDMIAAKRREQASAGGGGGARHGILGLEDSSEDEEAGAGARPAGATAAPTRRPAQQPVLLLDDSSEDEAPGAGENRASNAGSAGSRRSGGQRVDAAAAPAKPLGRLVRAADRGGERAAAGPAQRSGAGGTDVDGDDDLAAQLGGLSIKPRGGAAAAAPVTRAARPMPAPAPSRLPAVHASRQAANREEDEEEEEAGERLVLGDDRQFKLSVELSRKLYPHQVEGVKWLWRLHQAGTGGILADDMGLGKTMQCSAFLSGLLQCKLIRRAIVIAPKTLLAHWARELGVCGVGRMTHEYFGSESERQRCLDRVYRHRGVLLTTYGMILHNSEVLAVSAEHDPDDGPLWDVMILDEGHKMKNPKMQLRKRMDEVPAGVRVIISGTPIQNNLQEMHTLFDFACPGLLGDARTFKDQYEKRISIGNDKHATLGERERGAAAAAQLRQTIAPYFLRREKKDVFSSKDDGDAHGSAAGSGGAAGASSSSGGGSSAATQASTQTANKPASMGRKNDFIVWLRLKPMQRKVYEAFLNSDAVKAVFNQTNSALSALTVLKKICDHPALLSKRAEDGIVSGASRAARKQLGGGESDEESEIESASSGEDYCSSSDEEGGGRGKAAGQRARQAQRAQQQGAQQVGGGEEGQWWDWTKEEIGDQLLAEVHTTGFEASCKTVFVMSLLHNLVAEGHRTLIFSQSRVMLNILEAAIKQEGWRFCRIDGSVASAADREARVKQFQTRDDIPIFLLTSQVGGLGLTLTAADRVVIVDPAWNPSVDNQAVDRAYRIGQSRDVVVYRLISCGTVEEKIYRKQVYKGGLSRTGTEDGEQFRYFSQQELRDLFRLDAEEAQRSATQRALHDMHAHQRRATAELAAHLQFLEGLEGFAGVSDHDLLYSKKEVESTAAAPFGSQPPRAESSFGAGAAGRSGGSRPPSAIQKAATQGWSGGGGGGSSDISDLFSRAMSLGGSGAGSSAAGAAAAAAPCRAGLPFPTSFHLSREMKDPQQERIEALEAALRKQQALLASDSIRLALADGGERIRAKVASLQRELEEERAKLGPAQGGTVPGGSTEGAALGVLGGTSSAATLGTTTGGGWGSSGSGSMRTASGGSSGSASGSGTGGGSSAPGAGSNSVLGGGAYTTAPLPPRPGMGAPGGWGSRTAVPSQTEPRPPPVPTTAAAVPPPTASGSGKPVPPAVSSGEPLPAPVAPAPATLPAPEAVPPVSPLRAFGAKLFGMATAVLGRSPAKPAGAATPASEQQPHGACGPPGQSSSTQQQQEEEEDEVIEVSEDDGVQPAAGAGGPPASAAAAPARLPAPPAGAEAPPQPSSRGVSAAGTPQRPAAASGTGLENGGSSGRQQGLLSPAEATVAMYAPETQRQVCKALKKRLMKYGQLLAEEERDPQLPDGGKQLRLKVERLHAEYQAAKRKWHLLVAAHATLPADS